MSDNNSLITQMRDRLNAKKDKEGYAQTFTSEQDLLQIKSWIPLRPYFMEATGGQGIPCGHLTQFVGESDSGKTTCTMEAMVSCEKMGGLNYLIDAEHKFSMSRYALMGGDPTKIIVIQVDTLEDGWDALQDILETLAEERANGFTGPAMLLWDSIAGSVPKKIAEEEEAGNAHIALEAKINNKNIRKLRSQIKSTELACVFINHFYTTMPAPGKPPKDVVKGGEELFFMSTLIVKTRKGAKITRTIKGEEQKLGRVTKFEVMKGHFHGRTILKDIYVVDKGILQSKEEFEEYKASLRGQY